MYKYFQPIMEYLDYQVDLEIFAFDFIQIHDDETYQRSTFISNFLAKNKKIDYLIEDIYCYSLVLEEWEDYGIDEMEFREMVEDVFLLMINCLKQTIAKL